MTTKSMKIINTIKQATKKVSRVQSKAKKYVFFVEFVSVSISKSEISYSDACQIRQVAITKLTLKELCQYPHNYTDWLNYMGEQIYLKIINGKTTGLVSAYSMVSNTLRAFGYFDS